MKQVNIEICFFATILFLFLIGCNQSATTTEKNNTDTTAGMTKSDTSSMLAYDPTLDPLMVAGTNGKLIHDSLGIKMYEVWLKPVEFAALHSHPDHAIYVLEGGNALVYVPDIPEAKNGIEMEFKAGEELVNGPAMDSARNIGSTTIKLLEIDVHRPRK